MKCSLLIFFIAITTGAQSISPTAMEFKTHAKGTIFVSNPTMGILTVKVFPQPFGWTVDGDKKRPRLAKALPDGFTFKAKQENFTLGPGQTKYIDFNAACNAPCHFWVTSEFATPKVEGGTGFNVAIRLPVAVYICADKGKGCRMQTLHDNGIYVE